MGYKKAKNSRKCIFLKKSYRKIWSYQKKAVPLHPLLKNKARSLQIESPLARNASDSDIPTEEREHGVALYEGFTRSRASRSSREGAVVQLVRIPACHAVGREFESRPHRKKESQTWLLFCATDLNRASS